jgi:hypothetical protein
MIDDTIAARRTARVCGAELLREVDFHTSYWSPLFACREYSAVLILIITIACWFLGAATGQAALPPLSGSGKVLMVFPMPKNLIVQVAGPSPAVYPYSYDPKDILVVDEAGKPVDISTVGGRFVDFTAAPNSHFVNNGNDHPVVITKLLVRPTGSAPPGSGPQSAELDRLNAMTDQWRAIEAAEAKKKAEQEAARQAQADLQEKLRQQLAQKQEESRKAEAEENNRKLAQVRQKQEAIRAKHQQMATAIIRTKAKIEEEQEVAPTGSTIKYAVSPRGLHIATATLQGSRSLIMMDGIPGPTFDELIWVNRRILPRSELDPGSDVMSVNDAPVIFSDDGTRYAYVGRQGNQFVLMVDGKEAARGVYVPKHHWTDWGVVDSLSFGPGSNRLRYVLTVPKLKEIEARGDYYRGTQLVVEGDTNPPVENLYGTAFSFSRDGNHYAYFANFPDDPNGFHAVPHLVVDGKVNPPDYTVPGFTWVPRIKDNLAPLFTGDSKHLITVRSKRLPSTERKGEFVDGPLTIFVDQKPVLEAPFVEKLVGPRNVRRRFYAGLKELSVAPAGTNFIAVFAMPNQDPMSSSTSSADRIFLNDRRVIDVPKFERVVWSPNGKRYAAQCATDHNSGFMVIDGKKEPEYRTVSLQPHRKYGASKSYDGFTGDSSMSVYMATTDKTFLVVEGAESDGFQAIADLTFGTGAHFAFVATTETGQKMGKTRDVTAPGSQQLVVDGQALEPRQDVHDFVFNPDGTHYAFLSWGSSSNKRGAKVFVDGVEQRFEFGGDFVHYTTGSDEADRKFLFSPDGKHVLYLASFGRVDSSGYSEDHSATKAVCLDGKLIPCEGEKSQITAFFTPDSKHVMWVDWADNYKVPGYSVYVDGQRDGHYDCPPVDYSHGTTVAAFFEREKSATEMGSDGAFTFLGQVGSAVKKLRITPPTDTNLTRFAALADERELAAEAEEAQTVQVNR